MIRCRTRALDARVRQRQFWECIRNIERGRVAANPNQLRRRERYTTRIELVWKRREAAVEETKPIFALAENAPDDADGDEIEAVCDAAYDAVEDIGDEILATKVTSKTDIAIKARVLKWYGCVEDLGYYRSEAILEFFDELQTFATR